MTLRGKQHGQSGLIFICALLAWLSVPSVALALSARDLVIVFNRNLPESREVAVYYAGKRRVPVG